MVISVEQVASGQLGQTGGTFLIQQGVDADGHTLITTTRASPQTVSTPLPDSVCLRPARATPAPDTSIVELTNKTNCCSYCVFLLFFDTWNAGGRGSDGFANNHFFKTTTQIE